MLAILKSCVKGDCADANRRMKALYDTGYSSNDIIGTVFRVRLIFSFSFVSISHTWRAGGRAGGRAGVRVKFAHVYICILEPLVHLSIVCGTGTTPVLYSRQDEMNIEIDGQQCRPKQHPVTGRELRRRQGQAQTQTPQSTPLVVCW